MDYLLVFRKNNFIGLYNMTTKVQLFNTTQDLLQASLARELGTGKTAAIQVVIEGEESINPLGLPSLQAYLKGTNAI